jgi:hypothetical protein
LFRFKLEQNGHHEEEANSSPIGDWSKRYIEGDALYLFKTSSTSRAFSFLMELLGKR